MTKGVELINEERKRQIEKEHFSMYHDDSHEGGELAIMAACYVLAPDILYIKKETSKQICFIDPFPFHTGYDKRGKHSYERRLVIAGALIAAELDRLNRIKEKGTDGK